MTFIPKSYRRFLIFLPFPLLLFGCAINGITPTAKDLRLSGGRTQAVLLVRVLTEVDGKPQLAFPSFMPLSNIGLGLGDFYSGGKVKIAGWQFLSTETRTNGWAYTFKPPGHYFMAPQTSEYPVGIYQLREQFAHDNPWLRGKPVWSFEVPNDVAVVYLGTLFLPGNGIPRSHGKLVRSFTDDRFEIRDESEYAKKIYEQFLSNLGPMTSQLVVPISSSEPIILETPTGK